MADRLTESLRLLESDRDRLREFVADVSHELRTPLAALRTYTELQRDGAMDDDDASRVPRSVERAAQPAGMDERQPARPVADRRRHLPPGRPRSATCASRSGPRSRPRPRPRRRAAISVTYVAPSTTVAIRFDRERIVQLVNNLVGNAREVHPTGGTVAVQVLDEADCRGDRGQRHRPGHPACRAAAHLRSVLPRDERGRGASVGERAGPGHRALDRRDARRVHRGRQRPRRGCGVPGRPAPPGRGRRRRA